MQKRGENLMEEFAFRGLPVKYAHEGAGAPVILLHNGGASHTIWRDVIPNLAASHEVFALDLPGFGASAKPGSGYTLGNYVEMIGDLVDLHGLKPVSLVGNCMGSAMSLAFADDRPADVRALVLVNPLTDATFTGGWLGPLLRARKLAPGLSRLTYSALGPLRLPDWVGVLSLRFQLGKQGVSRGLQKTEELCECYSSPGQMRSLLGVLDDLVNYAVLDRMSPGDGFPPICTIWGLQNRILSPDAGRRLNVTLRPRRQEWLPGCGHLVMLEQPDEVARIIREFIEG
jgi:pimeloyl-ACP methyl ester carboxylesterase